MLYTYEMSQNYNTPNQPELQKNLKNGKLIYRKSKIIPTFLSLPFRVPTKATVLPR